MGASDGELRLREDLLRRVYSNGYLGLVIPETREGANMHERTIRFDQISMLTSLEADKLVVCQGGRYIPSRYASRFS